MRTIKFRAWTYDNTMEYSDFTTYLGSYGCVFTQFETVPKALMQFTGLKDKNGKEIYEGDIFNLGTGNPVAIIEYDYCGFAFRWIDGIFKTVRQFEKEPIFRNVHLFEVTGNIHENPELLTEKS